MSTLEEKIAAQKSVVCDLKTKHPKWREEPVEEVTAAITELKKLIGEQKAIEKAAKAAAKAANAAKRGGGQGGKNKKNKKNLLAIGFDKQEAFGHWYLDVILKSEMISHYPVSGCYVLRPWSYRIWEFIQDFMNSEFRAMDVENCYFPIFVPEEALTKEEDHLEGFAAEVAWITKSGKSELHNKIAIRPTSETVMYPVFADWVRSHRDLPMKLNQWCNIVRWEFKHPTPFLRTREFLWQEGHTVHATEESAKKEVYDILDIYARTYSELLAVPMIKGIKTEKEKFAGGDFTTTIEGYIPVAGRGIQAATSHGLGQNFAKMFEIGFEDTNGERAMPFQNSWGFTTRSIGVAVMVHGDNKGLILPPRVAPLQVICIPIIFKEGADEVQREIEAVTAELKKAGIRVKLDDSTTRNSGFKRSQWELKGVPLRIEIGPRDVKSESVLVCKRDTAEKVSVARKDLVQFVKDELEAMHDRMLAKATAERDSHIVSLENWDDFIPNLNKKNLCLVPFCMTTECEEAIKEGSKGEDNQPNEVVVDGETFEVAITAAAKSLCVPLEQEPLKEGTKCIKCDKTAVKRCLFGRSY